MPTVGGQGRGSSAGDPDRSLGGGSEGPETGRWYTLAIQGKWGWVLVGVWQDRGQGVRQPSGHEEAWALRVSEHVPGRSGLSRSWLGLVGLLGRATEKERLCLEPRKRWECLGKVFFPLSLLSEQVRQRPERL